MCLVREKRYEKAYEKLRKLHKEYSDDKKIEKFYNTLRKYENEQKRTTIIYQTNEKTKETKNKSKLDKTQNYTVKKENPW